jgi:uncharacterized protein (TIGR03067 family)
MMHTWTHLAAVSVLFIPLAQNDEVKNELEKLKGEWSVVSIDTGADVPIPADALKMIKFIIKDDRFVVEVAGKGQDAKFKIDPGKSPKQMDITPQEGPKKDKVGLAIYELDGDTLKICHREDGEGRPKEFKVDAATKDGIITLKRVKQ